MQLNDLKNMIQAEEEKRLINYSKKDYNYDWAPFNSFGSPEADETARPTLAFNFEFENSVLNLRWMYLNKRNQGLGSRIIQWFIDFCIVENIQLFKIKMVGKDKKPMLLLCRKFGFEIVNDGKTYFNFQKKIN